MSASRQQEKLTVNMPPLRFLAAVDFPLLIRLAIGPVCLMVPGAILHSFKFMGLVWLGYTLGALGLLLAVISLFWLHPKLYTLHADTLEINYGIRREHIPMARIRSVVLSGNPSAPDTGTRRVRLTLDDGQRLLALHKRADFISQLKARAYL